jgi:hypothetical protein
VTSTFDARINSSVVPPANVRDLQLSAADTVLSAEVATEIHRGW